MKKYLFIFPFIFFFSCKEKQENKEVQKPELIVIKKHIPFIALEKVSEKNVANWKAYQKVNTFIKKYASISPIEALDNAIEFSKKTKVLKDSITPKELITPAFKTRIHVFENEVLRLKDMKSIPAITPNEVNLQVDKIIEAFNATNSKINMVYTQLEVEKDIEIKEKLADSIAKVKMKPLIKK